MCQRRVPAQQLRQAGQRRNRCALLIRREPMPSRRRGCSGKGSRTPCGKFPHLAGSELARGLIGGEGGKTRVDLRIRLAHFHLPPVESALAIGKKAPIGANAMSKALEEILPSTFKKIDVEHPVIEAIILRAAHLQIVPKERLVALLIKHAEAFMSDSEILHVDIRVQVNVAESLEL
jgi:hypothetical protein